jgi:polyvinyl alcohol dehydrogenase (cytochrome)
LKLKWAFGYPGGISAFGQPTIASGRVFVGTDIGYVYSIDLSTGCVYWSFKTKAGVRNAMVVGPIKTPGGAKQAVYFGDLKANIYALDAQDGKLLWSKPADGHFTARITAAPTLYRGRLYVPVSSWEEFSASSLAYSCCTFRGSVVALDANTGAQIWKTYTVPQTPKETRKNSIGTPLFAPAGVSVWSSPTIDPELHAIYFGTGDSETEPAADTSDSVMALDLRSGKRLWLYQAQKDDSFLVGCYGQNRTDNCPKQVGPDNDIGNSPILRALGNGKRILIAGTKDGRVFGLDPDHHGAKLWSIQASAPPQPRQPPSGIYWGGAADEEAAYFGLSGGGAVAVRMATGERIWSVPVGATPTWNAAALTALPGVVFVAGGDGKVQAISAADGHSLWEYDTAHEFSTVNQVKAKGGSIRAAGMTVAGGMVLVGSGYGVFGNDITGNVLLAFSPQ